MNTEAPVQIWGDLCLQLHEKLKISVCIKITTYLIVPMFSGHCKKFDLPLLLPAGGILMRELIKILNKLERAGGTQTLCAFLNI